MAALTDQPLATLLLSDTPLECGAGDAPAATDGPIIYSRLADAVT